MTSKTTSRTTMDQALSPLPWMTKERSVRVLVIGDVILDEYLDGIVSRISPEAPVPVHLVKSQTCTAGGAANVARNIQLAGGQAVLVSVLGHDDSANRLTEILRKDGIETAELIRAPDRVTIRKTRVTANRQQIVRIDSEVVHPIDEIYQEQILAKTETLEFGALLISDYAKGCLPDRFVEKLLAIARKRGIVSIIDPKGTNYSKYRAATVITPNRKEACDALGWREEDDKDPKDLAKALAEKYQLATVLLTLGPNGMLLFDGAQTDEGKKFTHFPTLAREVYDVSGAGDAVAGILALGLASKASLSESVRIANVAAGRVVEKWGTQPITRRELEEELLLVRSSDGMGTSGKVVSPEILQRLLGARMGRTAGRVVFTNGCFDILHAGHVTYLEKARVKGDILVVAVNSDRSVQQLKGDGRPIFPLEERMRVLAALNCVSFVTHFDEETPRLLIERLQPDVLIKGADYRIDQIVGASEVIAGGGTVETVELVPGVSTSFAVNRIKNS